MYLVVDRVEWDKVVCQELDTERDFVYNIKDMPKEVKEGDIVTLENYVFKVDVEKTKERKKMIKDLLSGLY